VLCARLSASIHGSDFCSLPTPLTILWGNPRLLNSPPSQNFLFAQSFLLPPSPPVRHARLYPNDGRGSRLRVLGGPRRLFFPYQPLVSINKWASLSIGVLQCWVLRLPPLPLGPPSLYTNPCPPRFLFPSRGSLFSPLPPQ